MVAQTDPHAMRAEGVGLRPPKVTASPEGRIQGCPQSARSRRVGPLAFGLAIGAVLWLGIGLFSWQFFR